MGLEASSLCRVTLKPHLCGILAEFARHLSLLYMALLHKKFKQRLVSWKDELRSRRKRPHSLWFYFSWTNTRVLLPCLYKIIISQRATLKINIFNEKSDKNSSHVELHYYIIRRRIASDGNNIARAVRVSETEATILLE